MYLIGHLRPAAATVELDAGAITVISIPLTLEQITASTPVLTVLVPTVVPEPHFISSTER